MTDEQLLQTLGSWLKDTDAAAPDARRLSDRVMARVPQTRQRGRWWPMPIFRRSTCVPPAVPSTEFELASFPSANDNPSTIIGRTYAMFGPIKAIIAGALVFALGGLFLVAQPSDQQVSVPGVPTDEGIGEATSFEGVMVYRGNPVHGVLEGLPNGVITNRGFVATYSVVEMSDPRLEGTVSNMWNWDQILTGEVHDVWVGGFRIENPDGAWQMRPIVNFTLPDGTRTVWTGIFDGEGDYDGLTAIAEVTEGRSRYALRGIVIDGEVPPLPESMSTE